MSGTMQTRIVRVNCEQREGGYFFATSPDLKGLLVVEPTADNLEAAIAKAITDLYSVTGHDVVVTKVDDRDNDVCQYVTMSAEIAERALQWLRTRAATGG